MKKILALLLVVITVMAMFTACGNKDNNTTNPPAQDTTSPSENGDWRPVYEHLPFYIIVKNAKGEININVNNDEKYTGVINGKEITNNRRTVLNKVNNFTENEDGSYNAVYEAEIYAEWYGSVSVNFEFSNEMPENAEVQIIYNELAFELSGNNYGKLIVNLDGFAISGIKNKDADMTIKMFLSPGFNDDYMKFDFTHKNTENIMIKFPGTVAYYILTTSSENGYIDGLDVEVSAHINEDEKEVYKNSTTECNNAFEVDCVKGVVDIKGIGDKIDPETVKPNEPDTPDTPDNPEEKPDTNPDETTDKTTGENTDITPDENEETTPEIPSEETTENE